LHRRETRTAGRTEAIVTVPGPTRTETAMHIARANIDKYKSLLETETDAGRRTVLIRLLSQEHEKITAETKTEAKKT